jgi:hypothetical protein
LGLHTVHVSQTAQRRRLTFQRLEVDLGLEYDLEFGFEYDLEFENAIEYDHECDLECDLEFEKATEPQSSRPPNQAA